MKFLDIFQPVEKGNHGLTDEAAYKSIQYDEEYIPLYGAYKQHTVIERLVSIKGKTKSNESIKIFDGEGIIINFDGVSAGRMTYKKNEKFALNHHTGFFKLRDDAGKKIDLEYFAVFYQNILEDISVSTGSSTLSLDQLYKMEFEFPSHNDQLKIMSMIRPLLQLKNRINEILSKIEQIKELILSEDYKKFQQKNYPINKILDCMGGNSGLIEREIYQKIPIDGQRYSVLSSSTEDRTKLGEIPICQINGKMIKVFENSEGILVIRNGKAGTTFYLTGGKYTVNDHAYILSLKKDLDFNVSLKWLMYQLRPDFLEYSSSSDNGTWNMTGFFKHVMVDIPIQAEQEKVVMKYEKLEELEENLKNNLQKIEQLVSKQISVPVFA